jgi:hypothetical protein
VRGAPGRILIRSLLDIRLSRFSLAVLATLSVLATGVIVTSGSGRTPAQVAALAALRERATATPQTVAQASPTPATTPSSRGSARTPAHRPGSSAPSSVLVPAAASDSSASGDSDTGGATTTPTTTSTTSTTPAATSRLPKIGHVFEIALSTTSYAAAFGPKSAAPYLRSVQAKGTLLRGYESLGRGELADYLATISGQKPNAATSAGCTTYLEFPQAVAAKANGLVPGKGCVFPETALTIGDQASAKGDGWRAYIADMGKETCTHPNSNAVDDLALPGTEPGYDTRHNPFIYFHSLLDLGDCATDDQDLTRLRSALAHSSSTATFSFIAPGACEDPTATAETAPTTTTTPGTTNSTTTRTASTAPSTTTTSTGASTTTPATTTTSSTTTTTTTPTTTITGAATTSDGETPATPAGCTSGQPVGIAAENAFLKLWVPRILASRAYKDNGVLIVAFAGDRVKHAGHATRTGALVLSRYTGKGKAVATVYTPYSLLRSIEDMLGYTALAHATSAPSFAQAVLR